MKHTLTLLTFIILFALIASCQNVETETTYPAEVQGWVYDDSTRQPVTAVHISVIGYSVSAYTGDSGKFYIEKIEMPRDQSTETFVCTKTGYINDTNSVVLSAFKLNTIDTILIKKFTK
jgi:hypothetical protein